MNGLYGEQHAKHNYRNNDKYVPGQGVTCEQLLLGKRQRVHNRSRVRDEHVREHGCRGRKRYDNRQNNDNRVLHEQNREHLPHVIKLVVPISVGEPYRRQHEQNVKNYRKGGDYPEPFQLLFDKRRVKNTTAHCKSPSFKIMPGAAPFAS